MRSSFEVQQDVQAVVQHDAPTILHAYEQRSFHLPGNSTIRDVRITYGRNAGWVWKWENWRMKNEQGDFLEDDVVLGEFGWGESQGRLESETHVDSLKGEESRRGLSHPWVVGFGSTLPQ